MVLDLCFLRGGSSDNEESDEAEDEDGDEEDSSTAPVTEKTWRIALRATRGK